jgi:hypothetical protein
MSRGVIACRRRRRRHRELGPNASVNFANDSISRYDVGNQIGPRQLELPPLIFTSARPARSAPCRAEAERMLVWTSTGCGCRRRQELGLVPDALSSFSSWCDRRSTARRALAVARLGVARLADEVGPVADEPVHVGDEHRHRLELGLVEHVDRVERNQADQRADAELVELAARVAQDVVEEAVLLVPELVAAAAHPLHRAADVDEVLEELRRHRLVDLVGLRRARWRCASCAGRRSPSSPVASDCSRIAPSGSFSLRSTTVMLSRPRKPPFEHVQSLAVDLVDPPREVDQQLLEALLQELGVGLAACDPSRRCRRASTPTRAPAG